MGVPDLMEYRYVSERGHYGFPTKEARETAIKAWERVGCRVFGLTYRNGVYGASWRMTVAVPKTPIVCRWYNTRSLPERSETR